jgi:hypothetical protein
MLDKESSPGISFLADAAFKFGSNLMEIKADADVVTRFHLYTFRVLSVPYLNVLHCQLYCTYFYLAGYTVYRSICALAYDVQLSKHLRYI